MQEDMKRLKEAEMPKDLPKQDLPKVPFFTLQLSLLDLLVSFFLSFREKLVCCLCITSA